MKINDVISGKILSEESIIKRLPSIIYIVILIILYIFNIFDTQKQYRRILAVEREISRLKVTATTAQTERISVTKQAFILEELNRRNIPLVAPLVPPVSIKDDNKK